MSNTFASRIPLSRRRLSRIGGIAFVSFAVVACVRQQEFQSPFPAFAEYEGREIEKVTFTGDLELPEDSLRAAIRTRSSRCRFLFLPFCVPFTNIGREEAHLDLPQLATDVARIQLYYRDHGFYSARVSPRVEPVDEDGVTVEFAIDAGEPVILTEMALTGGDSIVTTEQVAAAMPLRIGEPFGRADFFASADTIRGRLLRNGNLYAEVLRNFSIDTIADYATAEFVTIPGPVVRVDTILFRGNERLTDATLRRQLPISEGDVLSEMDLSGAQRNLYGLDMVTFAAVQLAPDTLQRSDDPARATVLIQVVEAAQYTVQASLGFGTVECLRTGGQWANRNFLGGGRRLEVRGSLSRIGAGSPLDMGLQGNVCSALGEEAFLGLESFEDLDRIDYTAGVSLQQPSIFGTRNRVEVTLDAERISEPEAFIRESVGGRVSATREFAAGPTILATTFEVNRGRTIASPAILCVGFDTCTQEDFELLSRDRWSNSIAASVLRDATRSDPVETRGYLLRGNVDWASPVLGSDDNYLRIVGEAARYRMVRPGWMFASRIRVGRFLYGVLGPESGYIPPEKRFFAGGPSSVRGFGRNQLGPTSYVTPLVDGEYRDTIGSATGGTQLIESSVELRFPSPWLSDVTRLAVFVDAGYVSNPGTEFSPSTGLKFTPGAGIRFLTPVGPFRLDVAYNPYPPEIGPLYVVDPVEGLILDDPDFRPDRRGFLSRLRVQFALGQAF